MSYDGIEPTFSNDDDVLPSPPPLFEFADSGAIWDGSITNLMADLEGSGGKEEHEDAIEHTLGELKIHADLYGDEYDSADDLSDIESLREENSEVIEPLVSKQKRNMLSLCSLIIMLIVLAIGISALLMNKSATREQTEISAISESVTEMLVAPSEAPISRTSAPTESSTLAPTVCEDEVKVPKECYTFGEPIELTYRYCSPMEKNWLGVYREGSAGDNGRMTQKSIYWQLSCGGKGDSCKNPIESGNITMTPRLGVGRYQVYGIGNMDRPYMSNSASRGFVVRRSCDDLTESDGSLPSHR